MPITHQKAYFGTELGREDPHWFVLTSLHIVKDVLKALQHSITANMPDTLNKLGIPWPGPVTIVEFPAEWNWDRTWSDSVTGTMTEDDFQAQAVAAEKLETVVFTRSTPHHVLATLTNRTAVLQRKNTRVVLLPKAEIPRLHTLPPDARNACLAELQRPFTLEAQGEKETLQGETCIPEAMLLRRLWRDIVTTTLIGEADGTFVAGAPFLRFYPLVLDEHREYFGIFHVVTGLALTPSVDPAAWMPPEDQQDFWDALFTNLEKVIVSLTTQRPDTQRTPVPTPLLRHGHFTVMSTAHYQAVRDALPKKAFHQTEGSPWPTARLDKGRAHGYAQLRPATMDMRPLMPPEEIEAWAKLMWQQREELSDLDADALDTLSAIWLLQARSPEDNAIADVDDILAMRGLKPKQGGQGRRGGYEPEQRTTMLRSLSHIQNLWLHMTAMEVYEDAGTGRRRRKPTTLAVQSRAFVITDRMGQLRLDGWLDVQKFIFRPGQVFAHFLFGPGRQTALLSAHALRYDPHNQIWEKRLARYLSWQWRTRARTGAYLQPYRVATLLEAVGIRMDPRRASRIRVRLEKTLDTLREDGVIAAWQYDRWDETLTERRGWAQYWLQATILIEPPDTIMDTYQSIEQHEEPKQKALSAPTALGGRLKYQRQALRLTQIQAAEHIGIHQGFFSRIERGRVKPSSAIQKRLERWLAGEPCTDAPRHA